MLLYMLTVIVNKNVNTNNYTFCLHLIAAGDSDDNISGKECICHYIFYSKLWL